MNNIAMTKLTEETMEHGEDEISLLDIIRFFIDNKVFIGVTTALSGLIGLVIGFWLPAQYEATMNIQMATVANETVESPNLVVEKMKLPLYFSSNTSGKCNTEYEETPSRSLAKKLHPILNKNAPMIGMSIKANSPGEAKACLQAVLDDIRSKQAMIADPIIKQKLGYLASLQNKLESTELLAKLLLPTQESSAKSSNLTVNSLLILSRVSKSGEAREIQSQILDLEISMSHPQTQQTSLAAPLYASEQPVGPSRSLILLIALAMGFMLSILITLGRKAWKNLNN
jgi:hypothetical protein